MNTMPFMTQSYHLSVHGVEAPLSVYAFTIEEALNEPYRIRIEFTCADAALPLSRLIDKAAEFRIEPQFTDFISEAGETRHWFGVVSQCRRHKTTADETHYSCLIEPRIACLAEHTTSRLFQNKTVPAIIDSVLRHHDLTGVDFQIKTTREYVGREYTTQFNESDLAFITRLLEDEGMWYQFVMDEDKEVVVFGDNLEHYRRSHRVIPLAEHAGLESAGREALHRFEVMHQPALKQVKLNDYNYRSANTNLLKEHNSPYKTAAHRGSLYLWGQHHKTPEEGEVIANIRHEESIARQITASAGGNVMAFAPGMVFQTHPENPEAEHGWLITHIEHSASRKDAYVNTFTAMPSDRVYRPGCATPWPNIGGSLPARVVSPGNYQYAYIDQDGRYRVRLPFDLDTWSPGGDSRPVRLAKPYAGPDYGQHFPLHDGTEVMLSFIDGDPDRPYISSVMHNSVRKEHVNNEWNTRNVIRTWANNKLRMEDKVNEEHIKLATEYGKTQLNIGHLVDQTRQKRGEGFELRTDEWGALRATKGIFISADSQPAAQGDVLDMQEALSQLDAAGKAMQQISDDAAVANGIPADIDRQLAMLRQDIEQLKSAVLVLSAPKGVALTSGEHLQLAATDNLIANAGKNADIGVVKNFFIGVGQAFSLFVRKLGIRLIANQGSVSVQAQNDLMELVARKALIISSTEDEIRITAHKKITLNAGGSYITLDRYKIEQGTAGDYLVKSASYSREGPASQQDNMPNLPLKADTPPPPWLFS